MGPRVREDNGWGISTRGHGRGGRPRGTPLRGKRGKGEEGWVPASAGTVDCEGNEILRLRCAQNDIWESGREDGSPHVRGQGRGNGQFGNRVYGGRLGSKGRRWVPAPVVTGVGCERRGRGWVPASARTREGEWAVWEQPIPDGCQGELGMGWSPRFHGGRL